MIKEITTHFLPTFMPEEPIKRMLELLRHIETRLPLSKKA